MQYLKYFLFFILSLTISTSCSAQSKRKIKAEVIFHPAYKGGAQPSPEVLERCCKPRPYANKSLYLKKNYYSEVLYKITTDAEGRFEKCMKPGVYRVYINNETNREKAAVLAKGFIDQENAKKTEPYFTM